MSRGLVLGIEQGTTNTRAIRADDPARIVARAVAACGQAAKSMPVLTMYSSRAPAEIGLQR